MIYDYAQSTGINPIKLQIAEASRTPQQTQQNAQQNQNQPANQQPNPMGAMQSMMSNNQPQNGQGNTK
jgi:hypothetical protein